MGNKGSQLLLRRATRRRQRIYLVSGAIAVAAALLVANWALTTPTTVPPPAARLCGTIVMPQGNITVKFYNDLLPTTAGRFSNLFLGGYYNGLPWHRVENWVIQTGQGGSRDPIALEIDPAVKNVRGALGAARTSDPNSATTQFYILKQDASYLDGNYSVFGTVLSGMAIVDQVALNAVITRSVIVDCPS